MRSLGSEGELFDLRADPSETENVRLQHPDRAKGLGRQLAAWIERTSRPDRDVMPLSEQDRRGLEALGYAD